MSKYYGFILVVLLWFANAEPRCCRPRPVNCYYCDSREDSKCNDPFNFSIHPMFHPPLKPCNGCCVKMVQNFTKPNEVIRRMCTSDISINLFMVDTICMKEGTGTGHMCFCEEDMCNGLPFSAQLTPMFLFVILIILLFV